MPDPPDMGACVTDEDGDGYASDPGCPGASRDCDDTSRDVYPGAPTRCNGADNDCDGAVDEAACTCTPGDSEPCGSDVGACRQGVRTCQPSGMWGECEGAVAPTAEVCDGQDNDCDGLNDETFAGMNSPCETGLQGMCGQGVLRCAGGGEVCEPVIQPQAEVCDGQDNDCDGQIDEAEDGAVLTRTCGTTCPSRAFQICKDGGWSACSVTDMEQCDNQDSNCDGKVDNPSRCIVRCGDQLINGTQTCTSTGPSCQLPPEICGDGVDNNCNGQTDESCGAVSPTFDMLYIPGGTFIRGALSSDGLRQPDETPIAFIQLDPYLIDRTEVSRELYSQCVLAGQCGPPDLDFLCLPQGTTGSAGRKPVICVDVTRASQFCSWLGKRLPTEAEWEKAARGPFRQTRIWPWGDAQDGSRAVMGCVAPTADECLKAVDSYPDGASPFGLLHMAGNAAEYTLDFYDADFYSLQTSKRDNVRQSTPTTEGHIVRGGSYKQDLRYGRVTQRAHETANIKRNELGFRCVMDIP